MNKQPKKKEKASNMRDLSRTWLLGPLLVISAVCVFWRVFNFPFIQDDWGVLYSITTHTALSFLSNSILQVGDTFYRPLGQVYFFLAYHAFGLNPGPFHTIALVLHFINAMLVVVIISSLVDDMIVAWSVGFLYVTALSVHLDPLLWMVGFFDIGGAFFFFLALLLWMKQRRALSTILYVFALLTKEPTIILPAVIFFYDLLRSRTEASFGMMLRKSFRTLLPMVGIAIIYLLIHWNGLSNIGLSDKEYALRFAGRNIVENSLSYCKWSAEALTPLFKLSASAVVLTMIFFCLVSILLLKNKSWRRTIAFTLSWFLIGLLPGLFFAHHTYRYYLTYALPAFLFLLIFGLRFLFRQLKLNNRFFAGFMMVFVVVDIFMSLNLFEALDRHQLTDSSIEGTNNLTLKGTVVRIAMTNMLQQYPALRENSVLIFDDIPTGSFGGDAGPRVWYCDTTLIVLQGKIENNNLSLMSPKYDGGQRQLQTLDTKKTYYLRFNNGRFEMINFENLGTFENPK